MAQHFPAPSEVLPWTLTTHARHHLELAISTTNEALNGLSGSCILPGLVHQQLHANLIEPQQRDGSSTILLLYNLLLHVVASSIQGRDAVAS
jgi:hypothetical protein